MRRKLTIWPAFAMSVFFLLGLVAAQAADRKKEIKAALQQADQPVNGGIIAGATRAKAMQLLPADELLPPAPPPAPAYRSFSPYVSQGAIGSIVHVHTGIREADQNGTWGRHAWKSTSGKVHVVYGSFLGTAVKDNFYLYNSLYCEPDSAAIAHMDYDQANAPLSPGNTGATGIQNGNIHVSPSGRPVWIGRRATRAQVAWDNAECGNTLSVDTIAVAGTGFSEPKVYAATATQYVALGSSPVAIGAPVHFSTSADAGLTWSISAPLWPDQFFLGNYDIAGNGLNVYAMQISGPGVVQVKNSTDGGLTWGSSMVVADYPGGFRQPTFAPTIPGGCIEVFKDTAHIAWSDEDQLQTFPLGGGGAFFHASVTPAGVVPGSLVKIADVGKTAGLEDESITTFGLAHPDYGNCGYAYRPTPSGIAPNGVLYFVWSQPPVSGGIAQDTAVNGHSVRDVFWSASRTFGKSWDAPANLSKTNSPGCDGTTNPCSAEVYVSVAPQADSVLYVIANLDQMPGWQSIGVEEAPAVETRATSTWRMYLPPARDPVITANANGTAASPLALIQVSPGASASVSYNLQNTGLASLEVDAVTFSAGLQANGLSTGDDGSIVGDVIAETGSETFNINFDASLVTYAQQGLRSGTMTITLTGDLPPAGAGAEDTTLMISEAVNVYVVAVFCQNSSQQIHSSTNVSDIFSQGAAADDAFAGLQYTTPAENMIFNGGLAAVVPGVTGPDGQRWYSDQHNLQCLGDVRLDSTKRPAESGLLGDSAYDLFATSLTSGLEDSSVLYQVIWEQSNDPAKSDFLVQTVKAVNMTGSTLNNVNLGVNFDIDVTGGALNGSFDTAFVAANDGKTYRMMVIYTAATTDSCTRTGIYDGAIAIPHGTASVSPVQARGAISYNQRRVSDNWADTDPDDTCFVRYMDSTGYITFDDRSDSLMTGHTDFGIGGQANLPGNSAFVCPPGASQAAGVKPQGRDMGYLMSVKKVSLPSNPQVAALAARYGLQGLAALVDTITLSGPSESYSVIYVAGTDGTIESFMEHADSSISYYNQEAARQLPGGSLFSFYKRGDTDDSRGFPDATDVVLLLNYAFLGLEMPGHICTGDVFEPLDGLSDASDVVALLNCVFLGQTGDNACTDDCVRRF